MSRDSRSKLIEEIGRAVMRWQDATETYDETVGRLLGLNGADRRCLGFVGFGPQTANAIAKETSLTPAAVTALIDRLEERGFVRRREDPQDRRKVLVEATDKTRRFIAEYYQPIAVEGAKLLEEYPTPELHAFQKFLDEAIALQQRMTARIQGKR
jgi:DNA-binding MarR family transcriptional regulator